MSKQTKLSVFDTLGILFMGATARVGGSFVSTVLQLGGMALGVLGVLALVYGRTVAAIVLFPTAWIWWWLGSRINATINAKPLDRVGVVKTVAAETAPEACCEETPAADEPGPTI